MIIIHPTRTVDIYIYKTDFLSVLNGGGKICLAMVTYTIWTADIQIAMQIVENGLAWHLRWPCGACH